MDEFSRVKTLIGEDKFNILSKSKVAVFGLGGVGGYALESLCRSGIGNITVIDGDTVDITNINRQIIADTTTVGKKKTDVFIERLKKINPDVIIEKVDLFYLPENADKIDLSKFDYVIDAIDTVVSKVELAVRCDKLNVKLISCMGTGGKLSPDKLKVADIYSTSVCPLARAMRTALKKHGVKKLKVVYSVEQTMENAGDTVGVKADGKRAPSSMIFVPASAGLLIASEVVKDLIGE